MARATILIDEQFAINARYRVVLKILKVAKSKKFPNGIKAKFVLIDTSIGRPRLLFGQP